MGRVFRSTNKDRYILQTSSSSPGSILAANGSAKASVGQTEVICGIKAELTKPPPAEPKKGFIGKVIVRFVPKY